MNTENNAIREFNHIEGESPEGFFFGAHEGDGACFGFWKADDSESDDCEPEDSNPNRFTASAREATQ